MRLRACTARLQAVKCKACARQQRRQPLLAVAQQAPGLLDLSAEFSLGSPDRLHQLQLLADSLGDPRVLAEVADRLSPVIAETQFEVRPLPAASLRSDEALPCQLCLLRGRQGQIGQA